MHQRAIALALLAAFSVSTLLWFSLFMPLKPASAIFVPVHDTITEGFNKQRDVTQKIFVKAWDFIKGVAVAFVVSFIANMALKLMQQLESLHIIKNALYYSDALGYYQYIPDSLQKLIDKPKKPGDLTTKEGKKLQEDLGTLAKKANDLPFNNLRRGQIEALALANKPARVDSVEFFVTGDKTQIKGGETVDLNWDVAGENIFVKLVTKSRVEQKEEQVNLNDSKRVKPQATTYYTLTIWNAASGQPTGHPVNGIEVKVDNAPLRTEKPKLEVPDRSKQAGLTESQEKKLLKGGIALLTSQIACGGSNVQAIQNIALYQAVRHRGIDPRNIDPREGNFYTQMAKMGDPFSSPYFQELTMRDLASTVEAQARAATQTELTSTGLKSLRAEQNNISRTSQTIADFISNSAGTALQSGIGGASAGFAAKSIGSVLANIVTQALLKQGGTVIPENPYCGIAQAATGEFLGYGDPGIGNGTVSDPRDPFANAFISVNGKEEVEIKPGEKVTLSWKAPSGAGTAFINGQTTIYGKPVGTGDIVQTPPLTEDITFKLTFKDNTAGVTDIGIARVRVVESAPASNNQPPPAQQEVFEFTSNKNLVKGDGIEFAILSWSAQGFQNLHTITIRDMTANRDVGTFANASGGVTEVKPTQKTTYRATIQNTNGDTLAQKSLTIDVQQATKTLISEPIKPRE